jgi:hypothetical protein
LSQLTFNACCSQYQSPYGTDVPDYYQFQLADQNLTFDFSEVTIRARTRYRISVDVKPLLPVFRFSPEMPIFSEIVPTYCSFLREM